MEQKNGGHEAQDRLARAEARFKAEKARLAKVRFSVGKEARKERNHRLMQYGVILEKQLPADSTPEFAGEVIGKIAALNITEKLVDGSTAQRPVFEWAVRAVPPKESKPGV